MLSLVVFQNEASNPGLASGAIALLLLFSSHAFCATSPPTSFQSVLWEDHPPAYYSQRAAEWSAYKTNPCAEEDAWVNFYKYAQYANRFDNGAYDLNAIVEAAKTAGLAEDGFALSYLKFAINNDSDTQYADLLQAYKADANTP